LSDLGFSVELLQCSTSIDWLKRHFLRAWWSDIFWIRIQAFGDWCIHEMFASCLSVYTTLTSFLDSQPWSVGNVSMQCLNITNPYYCRLSRAFGEQRNMRTHQSDRVSVIILTRVWLTFNNVVLSLPAEWGCRLCCRCLHELSSHSAFCRTPKDRLQVALCLRPSAALNARQALIEFDFVNLDLYSDLIYIYHNCLRVWCRSIVDRALDVRRR